MYAGELEAEARQAEEELRVARLEAERRFSPPPGCCPWGCDGSGWRRLWPEDLAALPPIENYDIFWAGQWWTPCECNLASTHLNGKRFVWVRRYPDGYIIQEDEHHEEEYLARCPGGQGLPGHVAHRG